ncbi:hypothetical protein [Pseudorhodoferax sp. Leaf267]|uniref:hypothetical protein n=1 Tax=Pseudorhodoferax sp. Leaf267 TaxID=1736316 RepID=UPI0006F66515|nr:hypothetical protein [Pseudorhodoferax sp. Leaf267]KQP22780.1 hypothetical protein ASF43_02470 [Pseudorhodoferax sp. Leaf267]
MPAFLRHCIRRATIAVLLCGWVIAAVAQPADAQRDAADIKARFARWIDPPVVQMELFGLPQREAGDAVRRVVHQQHDAAVDALLALAREPAQAAQALAALRRHARAGQPALAEALLAAHAQTLQASAPQGAALTRRHALALRELPAALWLQMNPTGHRAEVLQVRRTGLFGAQAGQQALAGLREVWANDPRDPTTAMLLLWLGGDALDGATRQAAMAVATGAADVTLVAAAHAEAAGRLLQQGAVQPAIDALGLSLRAIEDACARGQRGVQPRDEALALGRLGQLRATIGDSAGAATLWRASLAQRQRLAAAAGDDVQAGLDLASAHAALALLPGLAPDARQRHTADAFAAYNTLAERDRFTPMLDAASWSGMTATLALFASALTLAGGLLLLLLYRWRVARWMARAAASPVAAPGASPLRAGRVELRPAPATSPSVADPRWGATLVQGLAGVLFSAVATALTLAMADMEFLPLRVATMFWAHLLGTVVVLWLLWAGARRARQWLLGGYLGGLLLLCVVVSAGGTQPLVLGSTTLPPWTNPLAYWVITALPSLLLLLLLNRRVRSVGPVLITMVLPMGLGGMLAMVASSSFAGLRAQVWLSQQLGGVAPLTLQAAVFLAGALLFAPLAALAAWGLQRADARGWVNDQTLVADTVWLFQTLLLVMHLELDGALGLLAFAAAKAASVAGGLWLRRRAQARPPLRLLLLRVFGQQRRSERLFDRLQSRWAWIGPIRMIAAPDLASSTIGPGELVDFVSGRLRRHFVIEPVELQPRLAALRPGPGLGGRYGVDELFCGNDTWQGAVQALMRGSDLVVMDLRAFNAERLGCQYELGALLDAVPAQRIVLIVDASTDRALLAQTLHARAAALDASSPNLPGPATLTLLEAGRDDDATVRSLVALATQQPSA